MKQGLFLWMLCLVTNPIIAQDISGTWNGILDLGTIELKLTLHLERTESGYTAILDSPDQNAFGIPVTSVSFQDSTLSFHIESQGIKYHGSLKKTGDFAGVFYQRGHSIPLSLTTREVESKPPNRPQEPIPPFPYFSEEVSIQSVDSVILSGTLTRPDQDGMYPAVILITGSGPQNRNEELFSHKPFLVLADHLTRNGIAVLRYDDRGTAKSTGNFSMATSMDFSIDVIQALNYLKTRTDVDTTKIGLIGHSEGGLIASMVAADRKDVDFIVLMAGTGLPGKEILIEQTKMMNNHADQKQLRKELTVLSGIIELIFKVENQEQLKQAIIDYQEKAIIKYPDWVPEGISPEVYIQQFAAEMSLPWMRYFIRHDPASSLRRVDCPVLALNGSLDQQVSSVQNLKAIEKYLKEGGNQKNTMMELSGLNHLFQEGKTGSPEEYALIEQTISPKALKIITNWVLNQVN